jgi:tRNA pseudouridine synthase 10
MAPFFFVFCMPCAGAPFAFILPSSCLHSAFILPSFFFFFCMQVEPVVGAPHCCVVHLVTQAGTYIKEFVHGDFGRTEPSLCTLLGCEVDILQLDVRDVEMEFL